jgi:hypothetical protein
MSSTVTWYAHAVAPSTAKNSLFGHTMNETIVPWRPLSTQNDFSSSSVAVWVCDPEHPSRYSRQYQVAGQSTARQEHDRSQRQVTVTKPPAQ